MPLNPFRVNIICKPLSALINRYDRLAYNARYDILNRVDSMYENRVRAISGAELTAEGRRLAEQKLAQSLFSYGNLFERMSFLLNKADPETIRATLLRNPTTAGIADKVSRAYSSWQVRALRDNDFRNEATILARRLTQAGVRPDLLTDQLAYMAFALAPADAIDRAVRITSRPEKLAALRAALADFSKAKQFDVFSFQGKPTNRDQIQAQLIDWLKPGRKGGPTDQMLEDMGALYRMMGDVRADYRKWWIEDFRHWEKRLPTEEEIFESLGGTYGAFMPRIWKDEWKSGFIDDLVTASNNEIFDATLHSVRTETTNLALPQLLRRIASIDQNRPFQIKIGTTNHSFDSQVKAIEFFFPGLSDARKREAPGLIRHVLQAANDATILRAVPSEISDPFYRHRLGQLGFRQSFIHSAMAYISAGSRAREFGPMFAPGGEMYSALSDLVAVDLPFAKSMSQHLNVMMGRNGLIDKDLVGAMHPIARAVAQAIFLFNPGPAAMNLSGIFLQAIPFAMSDGFRAGTRDLMFAVSLLTQHRREFVNFFRESRMGGSFAYGMAVRHGKFADFFVRADNAIKEGDWAGAARSLGEAGVTAGEFLAWTESGFVRPFSAALGIARFYRLNPAAGALDKLTPELQEKAWREMMTVIDQATTLQGGINSPPWLNVIRQQAPVLGSIAGMLTITPANLFAQFARDIRRVFDPTTLGNPAAEGLRAAATRRLMTQATFGTLIAGPFWFLPMIREMDLDEDKQKLVAFAQEFESRYTLAGLLNTELADRLNPVTGFTQRFLPGDNPLATILFGPLGRPAADAVKALFGDPASQRKALGGLAGMADLPPDSVLPSSLQYLAPAGVAFEKVAKMLSAFMLPPSQTGAQQLGPNWLPVGVPVPTLDGNRIDANGRPFLGAPTDIGKSIGRFVIGGRALDETQIAAEGIRAAKRVDRRAAAEQTIRKGLLDNDMDSVVRAIAQNSDLDLEITPAELDRERLMRVLLPQGRAVYSGPEGESFRRFIEAAKRLERGDLTASEAKNEKHIYVAGMLRFGGRR